MHTGVADKCDQKNVNKMKVPAVYPAGEVPLSGGASGNAGDVAELILFLASDRSRPISGTPIWIDGMQSLLV